MTSIKQLYSFGILLMEVGFYFIKASWDGTQKIIIEVQGTVEDEVGKVGGGKIMGSIYCHVAKFDLPSVGNASYQKCLSKDVMI